MPAPIDIVAVLPSYPPNWIRSGEGVQGETSPGAIAPVSVTSVSNRPSRDIAVNVDFVREAVNQNAQPRYPVAGLASSALVQEYFVDFGAAGNDANDGFTAVTPFKTLQKLFDTVRTDTSGAVLLYIARGIIGTPKTYFWPAGYGEADIQCAFLLMAPFPGTVNYGLDADIISARDNTIIDMSALSIDINQILTGGINVIGSSGQISTLTLRSPFFNAGGPNQFTAPCVTVRGGASLELLHVRLVSGSLVTQGCTGVAGATPNPFTNGIAPSLIGAYQGKLQMQGLNVVDGAVLAAKTVAISMQGSPSVTVTRTDFVDCSVIFADALHGMHGSQCGGQIALGIGNRVSGTPYAATVGAASFAVVTSIYNADFGVIRLPITDNGDPNPSDYLYELGAFDNDTNTLAPFDMTGPGTGQKPVVSHNMVSLV